MKLSVVMPAYNERESLPPLLARLQAVLEPLTRSYELIVVDDGSTDGTAETVKKLRAADERVKLLVLSRNFGHQFALTAGLDVADGDAVIFMDSDLQHPPELLPEMIAKWREGYEVVHTVREDPASLSPWKRASSAFYYWAFEKLTDLEGLRNVADFRLLDRRAAHALRNCKERARFLRGLVFWMGFRSCFLPYRAAPRAHGATKYSVPKMLRLAGDGIVSFSSIPLHVALVAGVLIFAIGFLYGLYALYVKFVLFRHVPGWTSLVIVICSFSGFQILLMGLQGIYLGKIFEEVKARPAYLVREHFGFGGREK